MYNNSLMLYKRIPNVIGGGHIVETLADGTQLHLCQGGKPRLQGQTHEWDCIVSLYDQQQHIDNLSFTNIFGFLEDVRSASAPMCGKMISDLFEIAAGADLVPPAHTWKTTSSTKQPMLMTSNYLYAAMKWIFVAEDRYYFSEMDLNALKYRLGRCHFLYFLNDYAQGVPVKDVVTGANNQGLNYMRTNIDLSPINALRDYIYFLHQVGPNIKWVETEVRGGRHDECLNSVQVGTDGALEYLMRQNKINEDDKDEAFDLILERVNRQRSKRKVDK